MTKDISGRISPKPLAYLDQITLSWKTYEDTSASDSKKFSKTLPNSGMMQNGVLSELQMSVRHTKEQDYSLLPTPTARDHKDGTKPYYRDGKQTRDTVARALLPTPTVMHARNHDEPIEIFMERQARSSTGQIGKSTGVAVRMLATPTINSYHQTGKCRNWGGDLIHDLQCQCAQYQIQWRMEN